MKNKIFLVLFCILLLSAPALACAVDDSSGGVSSAFTMRITALEKWKTDIEAIISNLKATVDTKPNRADLDALRTSPPVASGSYTKAEVDAIKADLQAKIDTLTTKVNQAPVSNPFGTPITPTTPTSTTGQVTWATNPTSLPQIFSGVSGIVGTAIPGGLSTPATLASFNVTPTGYVQPYTLRITNGTTVIQYVKPVITISQSTQGGGYYGGQYPQIIYYNVTISTGYGMVQGTAMSNFYQGTNPAAVAYMASATCPTAFNTFCPSSNGTYIPTTQSNWALQNGWWINSSTNPVTTAATTGQMSGAFPINISPSNANVQPTPSITLTTSAPALNGYGEFQMTPGQTMDILITLQVATLQQTSLTISNSVSYRQ
jgi:hypothetical protein